ncbi:hypothetical protein EG328_002478 [Venturia inaequalis]|uniref:Vps53 N-terminal domain-containing protein n=1 Tax=Venturia inaequalis TaxID=5025 RepID=A0A8H3Z5B7_VENIN|nr:hypothetical protein EG327_004247 [Venturia inaequalis]KAE9987493.1 hypothetical protein EG328_002478 [Venturia inaequalis]
MPALIEDPRSSLDSHDYDPLDHLNAIFSHASTLNSVADTSQALSHYQDDLDEDIATAVATQLASDASSVARIQKAKSELADLFKKIEGVRERAVQTEQAITDMTADIKRLDGTKRNLTLSMTALKRLQMLTTAYEQLRGLAKTRQYRECAQLLQAVIQLMAHFKSYRSIDQIAILSRNVADLQRELLEQVCEDFEMAFTKGDVGVKRGMLGEACLVMDALGEHARVRLVNWYCNTQLREYRKLFRGNDEAGSLDNISLRYSYFNRMLKTYDTEHASIFPAYWRAGEMLASAFCEGTRDDYKGILERSTRNVDGQKLDVNLLLSCLQETLNFEHGLERRFVGESRSSVDTMNSTDVHTHTVGHIISEAFEPYMKLWVESQDKQLAALIPKYRQQPLRNTEEEFSPQSVIPSSTELFHFYRLALAQCAKLSTGAQLLDLSKTFGKYLEQYNQGVLFYFLGEKSGPQGPSLEDITMILNTADYCYTTCNQLEEKIKVRIDEDQRDKVDLQNSADAFMAIAGLAVRAMVKKVEFEIEPLWREMRNMPWGRLESVGDSSTYVSEMLRVVREKAAEILKYLHKPQYARTFCDILVEEISTLYNQNVVQCRPISEVGAEQMLLDSYVLKKGFLDLPVINQEEGAQPSAAYAKRATISLSKIDSLLKTLQVRPSPPEALVQAYLIHIADRSETNFKKILELKGTRKQEQASLLDLFRAHCGAPAYTKLPENGNILTNLQLNAAAQTSSGIGTASAAPKFDASTFGSALMNVAREGVDRFGSPGLGGGTSSSTPDSGNNGSVHADGGTSQLNENLKNIGKFFRRDVGGRFGRTNTSEGR